MAKIQSVWAIDIGQAALKALKLTTSPEDPGAVVAEAFDFVEYPKILSQPDADAEELVREALTTFLGRNEVKGSKVALGVSGQAGLVKFVKLPPVEKSRIPDIVKFEARQHIPFQLEDVIWAYQQIGGNKEGEEEDFAMVEIGLFAMKRDQIQRALLPLAVAGIEVDFVQMGPIALYNYISYDNPPPPQSEKDEGPISYVLLDIGADNTDLIITDGTRIWQRNVPIGGNHFTRALTKELKQTFAKAEHLKRNATKAPDPRAIFTAMRGIFGDFASEIQRSIGFYSSVNRQAKIARLVGLGNGFKLPGLQKFLQQNINQEVERLDKFERLTGDEVITAPQFQENIASFAVAYGLGLQGLGLGKMKTNLLPPEIEQVRMIRRKKPWALAASVLLMLGFSAMFVSAWAGLQKVQPLKAPGEDAQRVAKQGDDYISRYESAKGEFSTHKRKGESLVADTPDTASWPALLKLVMDHLPNPAREFQAEAEAEGKEFDPNLPAIVPILGMLRVHIDKIVPVYRTDLKAGWFDTLERDYIDTMHPYEQANAPTGAGWVIQIVGHHYNPSPRSAPGLFLKQRSEKLAVGPAAFIQKYILPRFWYSTQLRAAGIHHATLAWLYPDDKWTTEKGTAGVPPPNLLSKAEPKAEGENATGQLGGGGGGGSNDAMSKMMSVMGGMGSSGMPGSGTPGGRMMGGMPGGNKAATGKDVSYLTRTDFIIQVVWQPPKPEDAAKDEAEVKKKFEDLAKAMEDAVKKKGLPTLDDSALAKTSIESTKKALAEEVSKAGATPGAEDNSQQPVAAPAPGSNPTGKDASNGATNKETP
jgi:type IV pilus assembly protein PilM